MIGFFIFLTFMVIFTLCSTKSTAQAPIPNPPTANNYYVQSVQRTGVTLDTIYLNPGRGDSLFKKVSNVFTFVGRQNPILYYNWLRTEAIPSMFRDSAALKSAMVAMGMMVTSTLTAGNGLIKTASTTLAADPSIVMMKATAEASIDSLGNVIDSKVDTNSLHNYFNKDESDNRFLSIGAYVNPDWNATFGKAEILNKPIIFSGSYTDLINKPTIPSAQVNSDWNSSSGISQILNKPSLFSGSYTDLTNKPSLFSGSYTDLTNKPALFDGAWTSLTGKPSTFTPAAHTHVIADVTGLQMALDSKLSTEVDPAYNASVAHNITSTNVSNWNTAFGWGNHAAAGYETAAHASATYQIAGSYVTPSSAANFTNKTGNISQWTNDAGYVTGIIKETIDSATTTSGNAIIYLTSNRTAGGTALYSNVAYVNPIINDVNGNFTYGWTISADKKTLTINSKVAVATGVISLLGIAILSAPTTVPNGTQVKVFVKGN